MMERKRSHRNEYLSKLCLLFISNTDIQDYLLILVVKNNIELKALMKCY